MDVDAAVDAVMSDIIHEITLDFEGRQIEEPTTSELPPVVNEDEPVEPVEPTPKRKRTSGPSESKESPEDSVEEEVEYIVEKILNKKIDRKGFAKYLVKWEGYPSSANTWEPLENLADCDKALQRYELQQAKRLEAKYRNRSVKNKDGQSNGVSRSDSDSTKKDYKVNEILGLTMIDNEKYFLISLVQDGKSVFIRSALANRLFPGKVIDFYTKNLKWK